MSSSSRHRKESSKTPRRVRSVVTSADHEELERHYRFVPDNNDGTRDSTWQQRMVSHYHKHLYKDYVLADLTRASQGQLGLRWRTAHEVKMGKGSISCGNKHCPSHTDIDGSGNVASYATSIQAYLASTVETEEQEAELLESLAFGALQSEFEVPFSYNEDDANKTELVKLRLCARCAPRLFLSRGSKHPCLAARSARRENTAKDAGDAVQSEDDDEEQSTTRHYKKGKRRRDEKHHRQRQKKHSRERDDKQMNLPYKID